jgi:hypothetical protein
MEERCTTHQFEPAAAVCRTCGYDFCAECVVYSFGREQPPFCVSCALAAAGVRSNAARPPAMSKREIKRRVKEHQKAEKARRAGQQRVEVKPVEIDWSVPDNGSGLPAPDWLEEHLPSAGERVSF